MGTDARFNNYIDGKWVPSLSGATYENTNPAHSNEVVGVFQRSDAADAQMALSAAQAASKAWAALPPIARADLVKSAAKVLRSRADAIAIELTREEGKTLREAKAEIAGAINKIEYFAGEARRPSGDLFPAAASEVRISAVREPLGVVALITPWNFPFSMPSGKIAAALLSGNTVVLKPATITPLCAVRIVEAYVEAGLPAGVLNLVTGDGGIVGRALAQDSRVRGISFTGSTAVGRQIARDSADNFAKMQLEMGGKNPLVVMDDADVDLAVKVTIEGSLWSCGQKCTATSRILVHDKIADAYLERLAKAVKTLKVGDGLTAGVDLGPLASEAQMNTVLSYIEAGKAEGARLVAGGERLSGDGFDHGFFVAPTIFDRVTPQMRISREEIFGPVVSMTRVASLDEAIELANDTEYGLSAGICTENPREADEFCRRIEAGVVKVNQAVPGLDTHVPFPGKKSSALGMGTHPLEFFTEPKLIYTRYS